MEKIKKDDLKFDTSKLGIVVSDEAIDFIKLSLTLDPASRLGSNEDSKILEHPWFTSINQEQLLTKEFEFP